MDLKEYQELAKKTAKKDFKTREEEIMCWSLGVTGEAGGIGDMFWYTAMICNFFGWNLNEILNENIEKLKKRFPEGFNYQSVQRDMIKWSGQENK